MKSYIQTMNYSHKILLILFIVFTYSCHRDVSSGDLNQNLQTTAIDTTNNPTNVLEVSESPVDYSVKVYLENSKSMYGYLPPISRDGRVTDFRNFLDALVRKPYFNAQKDEFILINNTEILSLDLNKYHIGNIDNKFLESNFNRGSGSSDFDKLFPEILNGISTDGSIAILMADYIYSPGNLPPQSALNIYKQSVKESFLSAKGKENLAVEIFHLESDFIGTYYDIDNNWINYNTDNLGVKRPYYVFVIGDLDLVSDYLEKAKSVFENYYPLNNILLTAKEYPVEENSPLLYTLNKGNFKFQGSNQIVNEPDNRITGNNSIAIVADLSKIPVDETYLMNLNNYTIDGSTVAIEKIGKINDKKIEFEGENPININPGDISATQGKTHVFLVNFPTSFKGDIKLSLKRGLPEWVKTITVPDGKDDRNILNDSQIQKQTYGFSYLVEGIYDAQKEIDTGNNYFKIEYQITPKTKSSGFGFLWIILIVGIIAIIFLIISKNKQRR